MLYAGAPLKCRRLPQRNLYQGDEGLIGKFASQRGTGYLFQFTIAEYLPPCSDLSPVQPLSRVILRY
ncbi:hypothetical protein BL250_14975 [Erwinia sp. OLTSP20]|nr:hypothetical protein BV501_17635 [Erwinia sp. OAMSP11]PIJ68867.1 hypothetical protein BK416_15900 [Erwinia sp. OLSSP12]PIJ80087.1 hypothetical protein BLD46_16085 [Erwinia sp. OLMTSP26]PIJ81542.1 hypothetical protein BLD49_16400 [Erwinia sp. OLMDSP33]PIJ82710.1 hypothetical protein BLD47_06310 [Erwinia sp. OLCASP19]PIJ89916.1 hypothetical protein BL250_14975 [Erwinia sp. OLTSP20]PIJ89965.1 hypothetical protein BL249_14570 [Erwinia sp. OLFS4]